MKLGQSNLIVTVNSQTKLVSYKSVSLWSIQTDHTLITPPQFLLALLIYYSFLWNLQHIMVGSCNFYYNHLIKSSFILYSILNKIFQIAHFCSIALIFCNTFFYTLFLLFIILLLAVICVFLYLKKTDISIVKLFPVNLPNAPSVTKRKIHATVWCKPTATKTGSFLRGHGID